MTLSPAFLDKVTVTDCLIWQGACNSKGYGCFAVDGVSQLAHRVAWEDAHGPIPDGMQIDHLCRVRNCVKVDHLEVVTPRENIRRAHALVIGAECSRGHVQTKATLYVRPRGTTECRVCRDARTAVA